ncbi:GH3 auxin-responsive promoter family protein, partial [Pseudoalteromonas piscicida]
DLGYLASEIRGSVPLDLNRGDGVLTIEDNFFEFIRTDEIDNANPKTYLADEIELGSQYYLFFTNKAGLYRYNINDIVQVTGFVGNTPKFVFVQKGKGITNITGEKIY